MKKGKIFACFMGITILAGSILLPGNHSLSAFAASQDVYSGDYFGLGFDRHEEADMEISDGWSNGSMFDCTWRKSNVTFQDSKMLLTINKDAPGSSPSYSGAEYRSKKYFHYGMFETRLKAIKNDGVVTSLFTYTGPADGTVWDEIDIEILGKDTTKVQFNYFTNGVGNHEYVYDLGFDASKEFHTYGFLWQPDSITWYVDGKAVYTAVSNIPSTPGKIMLNVWPGTGVDYWLNHYNGVVPLTAEYDWASYTKVKTTDEKLSWTTDAGWNQYTLEKTDSGTMVYRYGNQNAPWAYLTGNLAKAITDPKFFNIKLNYIDGNILALTIKLHDTSGQETEIGTLSMTGWEKGIHEFKIPMSWYKGTVDKVILMINSNPYQIDLNKDSFCKVELLDASLTNQ